MSSRAKGARRERQAVGIYEDAGYGVEKAPASGYQSRDYFDLYDLIALRGGDASLLGASPIIRLVQVKANVAQGLEAWAAQAGAHIGANVRPELVVCHDREGWRLLRPIRDGDGWDTRVEFDERENDCAMAEGLTEYLAQLETW